MTVTELLTELESLVPEHLRDLTIVEVEVAALPWQPLPEMADDWQWRFSVHNGPRVTLTVPLPPAAGFAIDSAISEEVADRVRMEADR